MFGKKKNFSERLQARVKKGEKKINKKLKKFMRSGSRAKIRKIKMLFKGPKYFEIFVNIAFALVVFFLFWKKTKDPTFLEHFGETKL